MVKGITLREPGMKWVKDIWRVCSLTMDCQQTANTN